MLFTNYQINHLILTNRIVMPPMCMYSAQNDGKVQPFHLVHYGTRAQGGVGLIIVEATAVESRGRISDRDLGIWNDEQIAGLKSLVNIVHSFGSKIAIQLAHAGRKSEVGPVISSAAHRFSDHYAVPEAMSQTQIQEVITAFGKAAQRAQLAGFDMVEIHGAHGYLINQYLSPLINDRQDDYGLKTIEENLFLKEVIRSVKLNFENSVALRISAESYENEGLHPEDYVKILNTLQKDPSSQIDLVDISSGGVTQNGVPSSITPLYQIPFAKIIKENTNIPVLAGGLITTAEQCLDALKTKKADLIWLGRELLRNPYWVLKVASKLHVDIDFPIQYKRAEPY